MLNLLAFTIVVTLPVVALLFTSRDSTVYRLALTLLGGIAGALVVILIAAFLWSSIAAQQPRHRNSRATATARHRSTARLPSHTSRGAGGNRFLSDRQRRGYFFLQRARP
jgi:hypothetical protein